MHPDKHKKTSSDIGPPEKPDYFAIMRTSEPLESYSIKELHKRIEAARKEKARKSKDND